MASGGGGQSDRHRLFLGRGKGLRNLGLWVREIGFVREFRIVLRLAKDTVACE